MDTGRTSIGLSGRWKFPRQRVPSLVGWNSSTMIGQSGVTAVEGKQWKLWMVRWGLLWIEPHAKLRTLGLRAAQGRLKITSRISHVEIGEVHSSAPRTHGRAKSHLRGEELEWRRRAYSQKIQKDAVGSVKGKPYIKSSQKFMTDIWLVCGSSF